MAAILVKRDDAEAYTVVAGDKLTTIAAAKCAALGWQVLARYNWGSDAPEDVLRALVETVGVKVSDQALPATALNPEAAVLTPDPRLPHTLKIPKEWKADPLPRDQKHTVTVRPVRPATIVEFAALDRWFIPEVEGCDLRFDLRGADERADKLSLEVFGSAYCECDAWADGLGSWGKPDDLVDEPVYKKNLTPNMTARGRNVNPGGTWDGRVTTTQGMLGRKTGVAPERYINVLFSPYTAVLRYWQDAQNADADAMLRIKPFWPRWKETNTTPPVTFAANAGNLRVSWTNAVKSNRGALVIKDKSGKRVFFKHFAGAELDAGAKTWDWDKAYYADVVNSKFRAEHHADDGPYKYKVTTSKLDLVADSLKIEWELVDATGLEQGLLRVVDRDFKLVFERPLVAADLTAAKHSFKWDGKYADGVKNSANGDDIIPADMPYRVQVTAHRGALAEHGLALAAMHTEVRVYAHPETATPGHFAFDPWVNQSSLALGPAPARPGPAPPQGQTALWYQYKLAEKGYHPGPVNGQSHKHYRNALLNFKRAVPQHNAGGVADGYERLTIDATENAETTAAIANLRASDELAVYGDPTAVTGNNDNPDHAPAAAETALLDPAEKLIVWVDDREYFTNVEGTIRNAANVHFTTADAAAQKFGLLDYRGAMDIGDGKASRDADANPRPWLPLQVEAVLLKRTEQLDAVVATPSAPERRAMRHAMGPLRVDWTFDELSPDFAVIDTGHANYDTGYVRSRAYVAWALKKNTSTHKRKDTGREAFYTNCAESLGGARPSSGAAYPAAIIGNGDDGLAPWKATPVSDRESVATVMHDHLALGQVTDVNLFTSHVGTAGAWLHPSNVAGDGYRVRAEVLFEKFKGFDHPNLKALDARYPVRPVTHGPAMRVWRKTSFRGYVNWGHVVSKWGGPFINAVRDQYKPAHVYFVHEGGAATAFALNQLLDAGDVQHVADFKNLIEHNVSQATHKDQTQMTLSANHVWPWAGRDDFGWPWPSKLNLANNELSGWIDTLFDYTWRKYRAALLLELVRRAERRGYLRGHLLVEFQDTPACEIHRYTCPDGHRYLYYQRTGIASRKTGAPCPHPNCSGDPLKVLAYVEQFNPPSLGFPAVGVALGATWLFQDASDARGKTVWAHEIGHHRHLEHSANGPGAVKKLHDNTANGHVAWGPGIQGSDDSKARRWDRRCTMSYSDVKYGELGHFCGVCLLRNRGWKVTGLGKMPGDKGDF